MNRYVLGNSIAPTKNVITADAIKSMVWVGFTSESSDDDILNAGYVLLPALETEPAENEVLIADKNQAGEWTLSIVSADAWNETLKTTQLGVVARARRNKLLADSDWTQGKDIPDSISAPWAVYRQALRDVTSQEGFPTTINWPQKPA